MLGLGLGLTARQVGGVAVPDPVFWLRADSGITKDGSNNVSAWASRVGTDSLPVGSSPLWVASDAAFNSQPVVSFNGQYLFGNLTTTAIAAGTSFDILAVATITSGAVLDSNDANRATITGFGGNVGSFLTDGAELLDSGVAIGAGAYVIAAAFAPKPTINSVAVNQATPQDSSTANGSNGLATLILGATTGAGSIGVVKIAEVRVYSGALSYAQRLAAMQELGTRYGITVGA